MKRRPDGASLSLIPRRNPTWKFSRFAQHTTVQMDYFRKCFVPCGKWAWKFVLEDDLRFKTNANQILLCLEVRFARCDETVQACAASLACVKNSVVVWQNNGDHASPLESL